MKNLNTDTHTTQNLAALDFLAKDHLNGSFKSFSNQQITEVKEFVVNEFLTKREKFNDKPILIHWHHTILKTLKRRTLNKLINNL